MSHATPASKAKAASECPPEQVTLVYRNVDGAHAFSMLEVPGLVVLDHDLERAFNSGIKGAGELIGAVCNQRVEYTTEINFSQFKSLIERQKGTANKGRVVTIPSKIQRNEVGHPQAHC